MQSILEGNTRLADLKSNLAFARSQTTDLSNDQARIRQNIDSLNLVKGQEEQVRAYSTRLGDNERQLDKLRVQIHELSGRESVLQTDINRSIREMEF